MCLNLLHRIYSLLFTVALPLIYLRLWFKGRQIIGYRQRWSERVGYADIKLKQSIWVHAVSVGEAIAAVPLVRQLQAVYPHHPIVITTMTPTGSERIKAAFKVPLAEKTIYHSYVPYDIPFAVNAFLRRINPQAVILMETEIWPSLLKCCHQRHVPVLIANGRLSPRSLRHYQAAACVMKPIVQQITHIGTQSALDSARFIEIGVPPQRVTETGNIKFDIKFSEAVITAGKALRQSLGHARPIWIAASTHQGEEAIILKAHQALKADYPDLLLILVPRHPERFQAVYEASLASGLSVHRRTQTQACAPDIDILLGDTMGELGIFYAASDIAFVGGSLVPVGGHNLLEPASLGMAILTGPHLHNFVDISERLMAAKGVCLVKDTATLEATVRQLLDNPAEQTVMANNASAVWLKNQGAVARLITLTQAHLKCQ